VKRLSPKGAAKGVVTDELRTTLSGVDGDGTLYLKVTGTGVLPSGATCQAQSALPPRDISAQATTATVTTLSGGGARPIDFDLEVWDTDDLFTSTLAFDGFNVTTSGKYLVFCEIGFVVAPGVRVEVIVSNGGVPLAVTNGTGPGSYTASGIVSMPAGGQAVQCIVLAEAAATIPNGAARFSISKLP
jgi:hypothetical protein